MCGTKINEKKKTKNVDRKGGDDFSSRKTLLGVDLYLERLSGRLDHVNLHFIFKTTKGKPTHTFTLLLLLNNIRKNT